MKKSWKRLISAVLTVSLISSFNAPKITFAENKTSDEVVINEENFPDKNFLNYIKESGFDTNEDGKLNEEELLNVKSISVKWLKIKSLKGIEYFKNIKYINAEMNYIEELDLSQNIKLEAVYCNNNKLTSIKLPNESENYTLNYLDIFANNLTEVDLHNLKGLTFLHIDDNQIEVLDLSDNPLTAGHGFVAQNNYMKEIKLPNNGNEYPWVEFLYTQLFPNDKSNGYKIEWYLDKEKTQVLDPKVTTEVTLSGQTLYAEYVPIEYTVKFNPGMAEGESITQKFKYNTTQNLLKNKFIIEGYEFAGWKDINGKIYLDEAEVVNLTDVDGKVINLTATWQKTMLNSEIKITTESLNKVYDGISVQEPKVEKSGSTNKTVFTWYELIDGEWTKLSSAPINTGKYKVVASVAADDNYKAASAEKEFEISKAIPQYENIENLKAIYGNSLQDVKLPEGFTWQEDLTTSVGNAGENKFKVKYTPKDTENYEVVENIEVAITVEKAINTWTIEPSIEGWKVGEDSKNPVGQAKFGEVEFTYSNSENGTFTKEVPTEAGNWYIKASVIGNVNYTGLEKVMSFTIEEVKNDNVDNEDQETDDETTNPDDEITKPGEEKPGEEEKPSEETTPDEDANPSEDKVIIKVPTIKPNDKNNIIVDNEEDIKNVEIIIKDIEAIRNGTGSLNISINNNVEINLPLSLVDRNLLTDAKDVSLKIDVIEDSDIIKDLKAVNKVFYFNLIINDENKSISIHDFEDGIAEITFALTDEDLEGLNIDKLKVYYYNEETKQFEAMETKVEGNNITFKTSHFSKYIISEEILDNNEDESNPDNNIQDKDEEDINEPNTDNNKPTPDKDESEEVHLPETGAVVSSTIIIVLAIGIIAVGGAMFIKKRK